MRLFGLFFLLFIYLGKSPMAQESKMDSLKSILRTTEIDKDRSNAFHKIIRKYRYSNLDSAQYYCLQAVQYYMRSKNKYEELRFASKYGELLSQAGDLKEADKLFRQRIKQAKEVNSPMLERLYFYKAQNHNALDQLDSSLYYQHLCIESCKTKYENDYYLAIAQLADYQLEAKLFTQSKQNATLVYTGEKANKLTRYMGLFILVEACFNLKDFEDHARYTKELDDFSKKMGQSSGEAFHYNSKSFQNLSNPDKLEYFHNAASAHIKIQHFEGLGNMLATLSEHLNNVNDEENFTIIFEKYYTNFEPEKFYRDRTKKIILENYIAVLDKNNDYQEALKWYKVYDKINDTILLNTDRKLIFEMEEKYESAAKEAKLAKQEIQLNQKTSQRNTLLVGTLGLLILGFFGWYRFRKNAFLAEKELTIKEEKIQQMEKEKKILSLASMIEGQEAERQRIAKDLHDGLGSLLANVKAHYSKIGDEIKKLEQLSFYKKAESMMDDACEEVRRISHNLMPGILSLNGLIPAIEQMVDDLNNAHTFEVRLEKFGFDARFDETKEAFIYRIIQELVNNIIKHAEAKNVLIQLSETKEQYHVLVEDDGKGFDLQQKMTDSGLGLKSLQSRIDFLNGDMDIDTSIGQGCSVTLHIPKKV